MNKLFKCWVISRIPFRESSSILNLITDEDKLVSVIIKGAKKSKFSSYLEPFNAIYANWKSTSELATLKSYEPIKHYQFKYTKLFCGFYLNELIIRAMAKGQILEGITSIYELAIEQLYNCHTNNIEPLLREFELNLLSLSGYMPVLDQEASNGNSLYGNSFYFYSNEFGVLHESEADNHQIWSKSQSFKGDIWLKLINKDFSNSSYYPAYKNILRFLLKPLIGEKPLNSYKFFSPVKVNHQQTEQ